MIWLSIVKSPSQERERDLMTDEQREFLRQQRLCIVGVGRRKGPPHMSPVYYVMDGDDILISTTHSRFKAKAVKRNSDVSLCVLAEAFPFPYLLIYGTGSIEDTGAVDLMMRIGERMSGNPVPEAARPAIAHRARDEGRLVLRVRPLEFRSTLPLAQPKKT
jgi:PPOX class probable F420-dependent enzyme